MNTPNFYAADPETGRPAAEAEQTQAETLGDLPHEMANQLTVICLSSCLLRAELQECLSEQQLQHLVKIERSADKLREIVDGVRRLAASR